MSDGLNKVMLIGNLGAEPELRSTSGGNAVLNMRLACSETYLDKNKNRQEKTEWVNVVLWGKRAEALSKILSKGSRIFVEGSLRTSTYEDKQGQKRYKTEVNATNVILCGGRGEQRGSASQPAGQAGEFDQSDGFCQSLDDQGFHF